MNAARFPAICQRTKNSIGPQQMPDRVLALILGFAPESFSVMRALDQFPVDALENLARSFPSLSLNVAWITADGGEPYEQPPPSQTNSGSTQEYIRQRAADSRRLAFLTEQAFPARASTQPSPIASPEFPTYEEMAASLDAEMARLSITPPVADAWGSAA